MSKIKVVTFALIFSTLAAFTIMSIGIESAHAATINVTASATDTLNGSDSQCSLREAIININDGASTYADCPNTGTYGTSDTINIPAGTYTTTSSSYNIAKNVSIVGVGAGTTTINGNSLDRVFVIGAYTVSISGVTITGGNTSANYGGGIYNNGTLTIADSIVSGNTSNFEGGGIYTNGSALTVTNSTISGNNAPKAGGIFNWLSTVTVTNSTISGNSATEGDQAGGIYCHGWLYVSNSTISGNSGGTGGGILVYGTATVTNSTISGNSASVAGGGIANRIGGSPPNSLIITNSTISGNSGGGISIGVTATLSNTIVANQTSGSDCSGTITSSGHNLESGTSCGFTGTGDLQNANPLLSALASNGGPTQTMALSGSSPAKDAGDNAICAAAPVNGVDQRGYTRPAGATCDIGAFEYGAVDTTPDAFHFTNQTGVTLNTPITSNTITVSGITAAAAISITGGTYAINGGTYTSASGTVNNGNTVTVQQTSSASYSTMTDATLTIGGVSDTFSVTTKSATTPDPFTFTDRTNVTLNTEYKSNAITVSGLGAASPISVTGGTYSINGGTYTSASGTVSLGNTVKVRKISAGTYSTTKSATLTIGGVSDIFSVTTKSSTTPDPFTFTDRTNVTLNTEYKSNAITVSGLGAASPISVTGGTYSVNGATYTSSSGTVSNGNTVKVRKMSAGTYSTTKSATLTIGGVSDTFSVTTQATP